MARIFLSHSSQDKLFAVALKHWLESPANGWGEVFLDDDSESGIKAGERWQVALDQALARCEVVICLISKAWDESQWCFYECQHAKSLNKRIFGAVLNDVPPERLGSKLTGEWQTCRLTGPGPKLSICFTHQDVGQTVEFLSDGLKRLKAGLDTAGLSADHFPWPPEDDPKRSPFRGLQPLDVQDAAVFFGRDVEILRALEMLRGLRENLAAQLFVILAASGTGKSSFLRAGLLPRLTRDERHFLPLGIVRPETAAISGDRGLAQALALTMKRLGVTGSNPGQLKARLGSGSDGFTSILSAIQEAARARLVGGEGESLPPAPTLVLPVDQAEELFSPDAGPEAGQFLSLIAAIRREAQSPAVASSLVVSLIVVFTIRSDRYEPLQTAPELVGLQTTVFDHLKPMPSTRFREVITGPARRTSDAARQLEIKPDLLDRLVEDCSKGADTLPLLSLTLERLCQDYGSDGDLRLEEYLALGGLANIIKNKIESVLDRDDEKRKHQLELLRSAFIPWLVTINPQNDEPMRRMARHSDLPKDCLPLVDALAENRLLTCDQRNGETVIEVAHETLLRQWDELARWLQDERADLKEADALERQNREWKSSKFDESWLWGGQRLGDASALARRPGFRKRLEGCSDFLDRSLKLQKDIDEKAARIQAEKLKAAEDLAATQAALAAEQATARGQAEVAATRAKRQVKLAAVLGLGAFACAVAALLFYWQASRERKAADEAAAKAIKQEALAKDATKRAENEATKTKLANERNLHDLHEASMADFAMAVNQIEKEKKWHSGVAHLARALKWEPGNALAAARLYSTLSFYAPEKQTWPRQILHHEKSKDPGFFGDPNQIFEWGVLSAQFSPDGKRVVTGSGDHTAQIWDVSTGKPVGTPMKHESTVFSARFSADGTRILTTSEDKMMRLWDAATSQPIGPLPPSGVKGTGLLFSPDGTRLLLATTSTGFDECFQVWDIATSRLLGKPMASEWQSSPKHDRSTQFSPDGTRIAVTSYSSYVDIWDVATGQSVGELMEHEGIVDSTEFNPDGTRLITRSHSPIESVGNTARIWDAATGKPVGEPLRHKSEINSAQFSPDGTRVVTASDHTVQMWDAFTGKPIGQPMQHDHRVSRAQFSPDGTRLVIQGDQVASIWDTFTGQPMSELLKHEGEVTSAQFSPDGTRLVTAGSDRTARIWDVPTGQPPGEPLRHRLGVNSARFNRDGSHVVTSSSDGTARIWDAATGQPLGEPLEHKSTVTFAEFSPDGTRVVTSSWDDTARIWDAATGGPIGEPLLHKESVYMARYSPDGSLIVTAFGSSFTGTAGGAWVWDAVTGRFLRAMPKLSYADEVWFSTDGTHIVTGGNGNIYNYSRSLRVWDVTTGQLLGEPKRPQDLERPSLSPDGSLSVTERAYQRQGNAEVIIRDVAAGKARGEPLRHTQDVRGAQFSPDGRRIVTACEDHIARIWEVAQIVHPPAPVPEWVRRRAWAVAGLEFGEDGALHSLTADQRLTALHEPIPGADTWSKLAGWLVQPVAQRTLTPDSHCTLRQIAERERDTLLREGLESALRYDASVPLVRLLLAGDLLSEDAKKDPDKRDPNLPQHAAFLRDYDLQRMPDDVSLWERAVQALATQNDMVRARRALEKLEKLAPDQAAKLQKKLGL